MTVEQLIKQLQKFKKTLPVTITDGYRCHFYSLDKSEIKIFVDLDKSKSLDIGIGGCDEDSVE